MERAPVRAPLIRNLELKVGILLVLTVLLAVAFAVYALYARGAFERTQRLVLLAENAEGVSIGMPISFSGFPIGQVERMTLTDDGRVRLDMAIPVKDAKWLRQSSVFTLEKSLVGGARIRAFSTNLKDPALEDGAQRPLHGGDASQEIPVLIAKVKAILTNVEGMTGNDSSLNRSLAHVKTVTERMTGDYGVMEGVLGSPDNARKVVAAIDHANTLIKSLNGVSLRVDGVLARTDQRLFGQGGVMDEAQKAVGQVNAILGDTRESLKKADAILKEAQGAAANVNTITAEARAATTDLAGLRTQVDDSLAKVNHLINEINRKWPFARDVEVKLP
jgi:phospholipid/cholesterol/gamma-HCH transport system substrate-binding protein